jgi:hypothetical protein
MKNKKTAYIILTIAAGIISGGCASIVSSSNQNITVASDPDGATIRIDGMPIGKTPTTVPVKRSSANKMIILEKDGYESQTISASSGLNPWFLGNFCTGGLVGSTTDMISGAAYEYSPGQFYAVLKAKDGSAPAKASQIKMYVFKNFASIKSEITSKPKTYCNGLYEVCQTSMSKDTFFEAIKKISSEAKDISEFSNRVAQQFGN